MNMNFLRKLPIPKDIKEQYPVSESAAKVKLERDKQIADVFTGKSDKFILIIGPCSADNEDAFYEYLSRLKRVYEKVSDKIIIIPRLYTNKPRSNGNGYMGMLHQPDPDKEPDILKGIVAVRKMNITALADYGFSCADEMLYPENHRYLSDLLSYVAVGTRSVEDQQHRLCASGLNIPVGMKNTQSGDVNTLMNSILSAQLPHTFIYRGWEVKSEGNGLSHAILRGYVDANIGAVPNYRYDDLIKLKEAYGIKNLKNPAVIIDTNHANSNKDFLRQIPIAKEVLESRNKSGDIKCFVKGLMIESYLSDGAQHISEHAFGKSITDPCLGWEKTEKLIFEIAEAL